jgi:hypothetical protein
MHTSSFRGPSSCLGGKSVWDTRHKVLLGRSDNWFDMRPATVVLRLLAADSSMHQHDGHDRITQPQATALAGNAGNDDI